MKKRNIAFCVLCVLLLAACSRGKNLRPNSPEEQTTSFFKALFENPFKG